MPLMVSRIVTVSMHKKSILRPLIEGMLNRTLSDQEADNFDLTQYIPYPCQVVIKIDSNNPNAYPLVHSVLPPASNQETTPRNEVFIFDLEKPDLTIKAKLSPRIQAMIDQAVSKTVGTGAVSTENSLDNIFRPENFTGLFQDWDINNS